MKTGYKILRPDGTSVNERWKYPLPVDGKPGEWTDVPYYGAFVSMRGEGLYCGGVPANWICVKMECEDHRGDAIFDVERYRRVRVIEILADLPATTWVGQISVEPLATLSLPVATIAGYVRVYRGGTLTLAAAAEIGNVEIYEGATLIIPVAATVGMVNVYSGGILTLPAAVNVGDVWVESGATLTIPVATKVGSVWLGSGATLNLPAAATVGTICWNKGAINRMGGR